MHCENETRNQGLQSKLPELKFSSLCTLLSTAREFCSNEEHLQTLQPNILRVVSPPMDPSCLHCMLQAVESNCRHPHSHLEQHSCVQWVVITVLSSRKHWLVHAARLICSSSQDGVLNLLPSLCSSGTHLQIVQPNSFFPLPTVAPPEHSHCSLHAL